ncbi:DNA-binding protein [Sedimentitalea sp. XS_ASV28]|uniref:DNA-binding protein n=1 Tax=Sedimentitalea sp. XS_ASV28 TaxID=3241296 RepID=UPI003513A874
MSLSFDYTPRLMPAPQAAHYLGMSETKLKSLNIPRRVMDGKRLYHVNDLVAFADNLPIEGYQEGTSCEDIFEAGSD